MNILISTTVGYNLGDEIILIGVKSLLRTLFPSANYFIYNRNPDLWHNQHLHGNYLNRVSRTQGVCAPAEIVRSPAIAARGRTVTGCAVPLLGGGR